MAGLAQPGRVLVAGWFSFEEGHATAGDLAAMELVRTWAVHAGCAVDVATVAPFPPGIDWRTASPPDYTHAIFVCGPFARGDDMKLAFLTRFRTCRTLGVNLSMLVLLDEWRPFDTLLERDSTRTVRPDIVLGSTHNPVPLIGRCLVEPYGQALVDQANRVIQQLVEARPGAVIDIDTRLDRNATGFRTAHEIESAIARMDLIVTTRLHGMVLALKHGVPAIAVDPEPVVGKLLRQAGVLGWPFAFPADTVTVDALKAAFDTCRTREAADLARGCAAGALPAIEDVRTAVLRELAG